MYSNDKRKRTHVTTRDELNLGARARSDDGDSTSERYLNLNRVESDEQQRQHRCVASESERFKEVGHLLTSSMY